MSLTVEFGADEWAFLKAEARRRGMEPAEYVHSIVHATLRESVLALFEDREPTEEEKRHAASLDLSGVMAEFPDFGREG